MGLTAHFFCAKIVHCRLRGSERIAVMQELWYNKCEKWFADIHPEREHSIRTIKLRRFAK